MGEDIPNKTKAAEGEGTPAEQIGDDWDTKLAKLKVKDTGQMYGGIQGLSVAAWNGSIDAIRLSLRAGKAIHDAIKDGIAWIKANHPKITIDQQEYFDEVNKKYHDIANTTKTIPKDVNTEVNRLGMLGTGTKPTYDAISEHNHPDAQYLSDKAKAASNQTEQNIGETWNHVASVMQKTGYSEKRDGPVLARVFEWENRNKKLAPPGMFLNRAQKAVYLAYKQADTIANNRRVAMNQPVYRGGNPTQFKPLAYYNQTPLAPKVADIYKNGTDKAAIAKLDKDFITNAISYGKTAAEAAESLKEFKSTIGGKMSVSPSNLTFFGGNRLAHDIPLPPSFTIEHIGNRMETLFRRKALNDAFYQHIESDPRAMSALGETKDPWGNDIAANPNGTLSNTKPVRAMLDQFRGQNENPTTRTEGSIANLVSTLFISSPVLETHKILSNQINGAVALSDNPVQAAKVTLDAIKNLSAGIQHAQENGIIKMTARSLSNVWDRNATLAERVQAIAQAYHNMVSLGGRTDKFNMGSMQAGFESLIPSKIEKAANGDITAQALLKKWDPNYTVGKTYNTKGIQQLASIAASYVHGTKDGRTMPDWMMRDGELSGFFNLAHWSIAQTNRFMSDVYTPATKGNYTPLAIALLGSTVGGYVIKQLREKIQGKHGEIPDLKEIEASEGGLQGNKGLVAYNLISAVQYAGLAGIISQGIKWPVDAMYKNTPQGAVFPMDEVASDLASQISKFTSAAANDPKFDWGQASVALMAHILGTDVQLTRIGLNQGINNGLISGTLAEKKNLSDKLGQLRRFDMVTHLPYDDQEPSQANPYMNIEQKKFKMEPDLNKAMSMLPGLVENIINTYKNTPDVMFSKLKALKQNQYETFPSLEDKAPSFVKYMTYLEKLKGDADSEYGDYLRHKIVNEVKASAVP